MPGRKSRRGRMPSIGVPRKKLQEIKKTLKSVVTEMLRVEERLMSLEKVYRQARLAGPAATQTRRPRGPNVRDLAYDVLKTARKALPIQDLARQVTRARHGKTGRQFAQNLSVALGQDRRFKRVERGVYGLR